MENKNCTHATARLAFILLIMMMMTGFGFVASDFAEDEKECRDQLQNMFPCVSFVSGEVKSPSTGCCTGLRSNANKTKKCLCVVVKDRNEPGLGFKINATLALSLPSLCRAPIKASECPGLLQLAPNSSEAQVFEQFAASTEGNNITAIESPSGTSSSSRQRIWLGGISFWLVITVFMIDASHGTHSIVFYVK